MLNFISLDIYALKDTFHFKIDLLQRSKHLTEYFLLLTFIGIVFEKYLNYILMH